MNLTNFLKETDAVAAQYSAKQLAAFIHEIGRTLPERCREDFLTRLRAVKEDAGDEDFFISFQEMYRQVRNDLKKIDSQELTINSTLNEDYDDWYDESGDEFYYLDENGVSDMLARACDFVHTCLDREQYREGFEIGRQLFSMEILCVNEYEGEELSIEDMVYHDLLHCDLKRTAIDTAYCTYCAVPLGRRPEVLYGIIKNLPRDAVTLETLMQHGDEDLRDLKKFLPLWIAYLGNKVEYNADRLILEAVDLLNDVPAAARYAAEFAAVHPALYLGILENGSFADANRMVSLGMDAIKRIPKKYTMRSQAALKTAEYLVQTDQEPALAEKCYFAAYESDTSACSYFRALFNGYGTDEKRGELRKVFMELSASENDFSHNAYENDGSCSERRRNAPDKNMILTLRFLDGQFADVLSEGLNKSQPLGWTGTFMKQGIALYLLYLYEGCWADLGIQAMASIAKRAMMFSPEEYQKGLDGSEPTDDGDYFCKLFVKWKSMTPMMPDVRTCALMKIAALLEKRTDGIMSANRRNYYWECAAYIAALGEVQESLGIPGAKQKLMTSYKDKYSRRNAFRAELRKCGWIDKKRK